MTSTRSLTFTTTVRVIHRVHRDAANCRTHASPALRTGLAKLTQAVLGVAHFAQGRAALGQDLAHFARAKTQGGVVTFTSNQLSASTGTASNLRAFTRLQFDTVNGRTERDVTQRQGIAFLDRRVDTRFQHVTGADALRRWGLDASLEALVRVIRTRRPRTVLTFAAYGTDELRLLVEQAGGVPKFVTLKPPHWTFTEADLAAARRHLLFVRAVDDEAPPAAADGEATWVPGGGRD